MHLPINSWLKGHCGRTMRFFYTASRPKCGWLPLPTWNSHPACSHCTLYWNVIWSACFDLFWELRSKPIGALSANCDQLPVDLCISTFGLHLFTCSLPTVTLTRQTVQQPLQPSSKPNFFFFFCCLCRQTGWHYIVRRYVYRDIDTYRRPLL